MHIQCRMLIAFTLPQCSNRLYLLYLLPTWKAIIWKSWTFHELVWFHEIFYNTHQSLMRSLSLCLWLLHVSSHFPFNTLLITFWSLKQYTILLQYHFTFLLCVFIWILTNWKTTGVCQQKCQANHVTQGNIPRACERLQTWIRTD